MSAGKLHIRTMTDADIPLGMRLKEQAGWNQTEADWRRFLSISPEGCFAGEWNGRGIATAIVFQFGRVAWIAVVLVGEAHRGRGIGTQMMIHALEWCDQRNIEAVRLDATKLGKPLYEKLGFEVQYELTRFEGIAHPAKDDAGKSIELADGPAELLPLDNAMPGTDRFVLLEALWREAPESIRVVRDEGFAMLRPGFRATQVGPVIASNASAGLALLNHALKQCEGRRIYVDIPVDNRPAVQWAQARGLEAQRPLIRMLRGEAAPDNTARIFASSGPEKG